MTQLTPVVLTVLTLTLATSTVQAADIAKAITAPKPGAKADTAFAKVVQESSASKDPATVEGVTERDGVQRVCSQFANHNAVPAAVTKKLEDVQFKTTRYPAGDTQPGNWKKGEKTARSDRGARFSDPTGAMDGANCYACHRLSKNELSYGIIGPPPCQYGRLRGNSEAILCYTWGKTYDSNTYAACSNIPRFGHKGILTEQQIHDVMALLFDPASPVNQ